MKKLHFIFVFVMLLLADTPYVFSQSGNGIQEFGILAGGFSNFQAHKDFLKNYISVLYAAPYVRVGRHEFSLGIDYPLQAPALDLKDVKVNPLPGLIANYKFFVLDPGGRENMFIHYSFEYLNYKLKTTLIYPGGDVGGPATERDNYINNVIGLGYNLYFDPQRRFGFYYILDYMITQTGYRLDYPGHDEKSWTVNYIWNNLSNQFGFIFKLTPLAKSHK